jgi:hypothetical protein
LVQPGQAQASDGSSFAGTDGTLYMHITRTPAFATWSNTLADDPANEGSDDGLNVIAFAAGGGTATFDFPMTPDLSAAVALTKGADVAFDLWVGGSGPEQNGQVTVTATLFSGATTVATAKSGSVTYQGDMHEVTMTGPALVDAIAKADGLSLHLDLDGAGTFIHVGNGAPTQSKVTLPVVQVPEVVAPSVTHQNLTGPSVTISNNLTNATSRVDHYNWTATQPGYVLSYNATVGNGSVALSVADATGKAVYNRTINATGADHASLAGLQTGNWSITINYTAFRGRLQVGLAPASPPVSNSTTSASSRSTSTTTSSSSSPAKASPMLAPGAALVAVVVAAAWRRRS